jgi:uncharacterized protein YegP (UPF0339 family)
MRPPSLLSTLLLVSICAAGSACDPRTAPPTNYASPAATQTPTHTPTPTASPAATASPAPTASPSAAAPPSTTASPSPSTTPARMTYSVYKDAGGQWRWRLLAANNRIVADSGEGYHNKQNCLTAIELIKEEQVGIFYFGLIFPIIALASAFTLIRYPRAVSRA